MENFLKLMTELWRLHGSGFRGQVVVNFNGKGVQDIKTTHHQILQEIQFDEGLVSELQEVAKKVTGFE